MQSVAASCSASTISGNETQLIFAFYQKLHSSIRDISYAPWAIYFRFIDPFFAGKNLAWNGKHRFYECHEICHHLIDSAVALSSSIRPLASGLMALLSKWMTSPSALDFTIASILSRNESLNSLMSKSFVNFFTISRPNSISFSVGSGRSLICAALPGSVLHRDTSSESRLWNFGSNARELCVPWSHGHHPNCAFAGLLHELSKKRIGSVPTCLESKEMYSRSNEVYLEEIHKFS